MCRTHALLAASPATRARLRAAPLAPPRVSEKGTLQLSIDADAVRRLLLELPRAARALEHEASWSSYAHYVEREMGGAVNLVKVLQVGASEV